MNAMAVPPAASVTAARKVGANRLQRALVVIVATCISAALAETVIRLVKPQNLSGTWLAPTANGILVNRPHATTIQQWKERVIPIRINSLHMRGGDPAPADCKVLCLGDSFTFGWLIDEDKTFVRHLERMANEEFQPAALSFLNGGTGGWGAAHYTRFYECYGKDVGARLVIAFLNFDDVARTRRSGLYQWSGSDRAGLSPSPGAQGKKDWLREIAQSLPAYPWLLEHSHLVQLSRQAVLSWRYKGPPPDFTEPEAKEATELTQAVFQRLARSCAGRGARLVVVALGCGEAVHSLAPEYWTAADRKFAEKAPAFFASLQVPYVDLSAAMKSAMGDDFRRYFIPDDVHFTEEGAALFARIAWPWLSGELKKLLPPNRP